MKDNDVISVRPVGEQVGVSVDHPYFGQATMSEGPPLSLSSIHRPTAGPNLDKPALPDILQAEQRSA